MAKIEVRKTDNGAWIAESEPTIDEKGISHSFKSVSSVSEEHAVEHLKEVIKEQND